MITITPPPRKDDPRFDDWLLLFWQRLQQAGVISSGSSDIEALTAEVYAASSGPALATATQSATIATQALIDPPFALRGSVSELEKRVSSIEQQIV